MDKPDVRAVAEDVPARRWICCAIEATWGERCSDFDPTCATCRTWAEYDVLTTTTRETAKAEGRRKGLEEAALLAEAQPFYPDTHTGTRQQWVKDQIAAAIRALAKAEER